MTAAPPLCPAVDGGLVGFAGSLPFCPSLVELSVLGGSSVRARLCEGSWSLLCPSVWAFLVGLFSLGVLLPGLSLLGESELGESTLGKSTLGDFSAGTFTL